jgi:hypothetical protein
VTAPQHQLRYVPCLFSRHRKGTIVGLTRKLMSLSTLGAVDMRSDKERTAAYTRASKNEAKKQTKMMKQASRNATSPSVEAAARLRAARAQEEEVADLRRELASLRGQIADADSDGSTNEPEQPGPPSLREEWASLRESVKKPYEPRPDGLLARMQADTERRRVAAKARKDARQ